MTKDTLQISEREYFSESVRPGRRGCTLSCLQVLLCVVVVILLIAVMGILMAMFGPGRKDLKYRDPAGDCKGLSGLYMAETLLRMKKETSVCVFEKESRFGGRILDHYFTQAPDIAVGMGAWRIDNNFQNMNNLIRRFNISTISWDMHNSSQQESRGIFANSTMQIKQQAFPTLNKGRFENMTSNDMVDYAFSDERVSTAPIFTSLHSYMSYYLSPEAAEFLSELYGFKGDYTETINPAAYIEYSKLLFADLSNEHERPLRGMSEVINALVSSVRNYGGKLYPESEILSVDKIKENFILTTTNLIISAEKLVIATHPAAYMKVKGGVSEEIHRQPVFQSIKIMPAFKGAAVYREAWWENKTESLTLVPRQRFVSNSYCLGVTMPYGGRGPNGEAVLHTMYMDGACSMRWGDVLRVSKSHMDRELKRALEYKFGRPVPDPLDTVYQYWDEGAWHFQKPGFDFTLTDVRDWAQRPFPEQEIFIIGDAYHPYRGWTEGAVLSANNALLAGWQIKEASFSRRKKSMPVPWRERLLDPSRDLQIH